jgi:hypothetical protein
MRRALLLLAGLMLFAGKTRGQDTPKAELSVNYSYFRAGGVDGFSLHGQACHWRGT